MGFYDTEQYPPLPHLRLPMPTLEELARHDSPPSDEMRAAILNAATQQDDAYWIHAQVHQQHRSVTIGQVAIVLLEAKQ
jgi:hypothetical protein